MHLAIPLELLIRKSGINWPYGAGLIPYGEQRSADKLLQIFSNRTAGQVLALMRRGPIVREHDAPRREATRPSLKDRGYRRGEKRKSRHRPGGRRRGIGENIC